jgi:hypothetical protein
MESGSTFVTWVIFLGGRVAQVAIFLDRTAGSVSMVWYATLPDPPPNLADGSLLGGHIRVKGERKGSEKRRVGGVPLP